jgi:hypothetical protein
MSNDDDHNHDFDDAVRALETRQMLDGSFSLNGNEYPLRIQEPTLGELEDIDAESGPDAGEAEVIRRIADRYLEAPAVDVDEIGVSKLFALFEGMRETWEQSDAFADAREEMPVEGNRR